MPREHQLFNRSFGPLIRLSLRITQFALAAITIGLFASDFSSSGSKTNHIYALVTAVLSTTASAFHCVVGVKHAAWFLLDFCLCVLWAALAGTIGMDVFHDSHEIDLFGNEPLRGDRRTRFVAAAVIALISMCFWLGSCVYGWACCCAQRRGKGVREVHSAMVVVDCEEVGYFRESGKPRQAGNLAGSEESEEGGKAESEKPGV